MLEQQVRKGTVGVTYEQATKITVPAYDLVWASGTGKTASKEQAQEANVFLGKVLAVVNISVGS